MMDISDPKNFRKISESANFVNVYAEIAGCTIYRINDTDRTANFMFLINDLAPYEDIHGEITKQEYEKKKVASVTMSYNQAKAFYESLKRQFEGE